MVWAGSPFAQKIEFVTGTPVGDVSYQLLGHDGSKLVDTSFTPSEGAVSWLIVIPAEHNTCSLPLFENRTLVWSYTTADGVVNDRVTYRVDRPLPFAVTPRGVRTKLGLADHEIDDDQIDLVAAYAEFAALVPAAALTAAETAGDRTTLLCLNAIEALAALALLPTVQMFAAQREDSASSQWARFRNIDWSGIEAGLLSVVTSARAALDGAVDTTGTNVLVFTTAPRSPDGITGEEA